MRIQKVRERMKDRGITVERMSTELGVDDSTFYRKCKNNGEGFSALDLMTFKRVLEMDEETALDFLLSEDSQKCEAKGA